MDAKLKKGIFFGLIGNLFVGFQPIVANSRPESLDALIFASMTCLVEAMIFFPIMLIEINRKSSKKLDTLSNNENQVSVLKNWKKNVKLLIIIGIIFGVNQFLFFIGYQYAGAINGSLTQKTTVFFSLLFGYIILKEKITKKQIIFSIVLFFGLILAITQGSFNFLLFGLEGLLGVLILLGMTCLWMYGHSITKPIFNRNEATPIQMVFLRNILSAIILIVPYIIIFPISNFQLLLIPINAFYCVLMGVIYGAGLAAWYFALSYLDVSVATIIFSPTPIVTAIFATVILGEAFTIFHIIGTFLVILSIFIILRQK
ncbi:MAG: DMT family transporter [Candidatus Thorarchaeota archaeon]